MVVLLHPCPAKGSGRVLGVGGTVGSVILPPEQVGRLLSQGDFLNLVEKVLIFRAVDRQTACKHRRTSDFS